MSITEMLKETPGYLLEALYRLRLNVSRTVLSAFMVPILNDMQTIVDIAEQKANYLGLQTFRVRNLSEHGKSISILAFPRIPPTPSRCFQVREIRARITLHPTRALPHALPGPGRRG